MNLRRCRRATCRRSTRICPPACWASRPDLRAAELRLRESLASLDQAKLSFYPSLTLTGSLGGTSNALANLLQNPIGTAGADIALPFLNYPQLKLSVGVSRASYDLAVVNFRQTLYQALTDVENALSARTQYAGRGRRSGRVAETGPDGGAAE